MPLMRPLVAAFRLVFDLTTYDTSAFLHVKTLAVQPLTSVSPRSNNGSALPFEFLPAPTHCEYSQRSALNVLGPLPQELMPCLPRLLV
jgi:hypothetical protein